MTVTFAKKDDLRSIVGTILVSMTLYSCSDSGVEQLKLLAANAQTDSSVPTSSAGNETSVVSPAQPSTLAVGPSASSLPEVDEAGIHTSLIGTSAVIDTLTVDSSDSDVVTEVLGGDSSQAVVGSIIPEVNVIEPSSVNPFEVTKVIDAELPTELAESSTPVETVAPDNTGVDSTTDPVVPVDEANTESDTVVVADSNTDENVSTEIVPESEVVDSGTNDNVPVEVESVPAVAAALPLNNSFTARSFNIGENPGDVVKIIENMPVSKSQVMVQQTPVDTQHGYLYTANIEHGPNGDKNGIDLRTVVRQGIQNSDGSWSWKKTTVEPRTIHDRYHTAPSVSADPDGMVHVVYNMHNFPWQYKRSNKPHDIDSFEFRGQAVTDAEISRTKYENKTSFPVLGTADIPGTQVTYPAFYKDRNRDLHVTYRFAAKPKRSFSERTMSGGVASYDRHSKTWRAVGGKLDVVDGYDYTAHQDAPSQPTLVAGETGWTIYHPRLMFGPDNEMNINWFWRNGIAGALISRPCFVKTRDGFSFQKANGSSISVPVKSNQCSNMGFSNDKGFYSIGGSAMDSSGTPHIVVSPISGSRQILTFDKNTNQWNSENSPSNATEIFFDKQDNLWAVKDGLKLMVRYKGTSSWKTVFEEKVGGCYPKATVNEAGDTAFIHTLACNETWVTIYGVRLN